MLNMIKGCHIHSSQQLKEEYTHNEFTWTANVNADKIGPLVQDFIAIQASPVFFILELPCRRTEEEIWREQGIETFHKNIYYMDGLSRKKACSLLETYGELLIHDGMSSFGFGAHDHTAEIMSEKYNVVTLWSKDQTKYDTFFEAHGIQKAHHMVTAWNTGAHLPVCAQRRQYFFPGGSAQAPGALLGGTAGGRQLSHRRTARVAALVKMTSGILFVPFSENSFGF